MADTTFNAGTVIASTWLNDINDTAYSILGNGTVVPATKAAARDNLGLEIGVDIPSNTGTGATGNWAINSTNVTGTVAVANGGTGQTTILAARAALEATRGVQPITASVAANALTLTLNPTTLDFRSATLGSGTVNVRTIAAAISLVISSGSTLGTTNAALSRIAVLAIDNSGTVELAAVNLAGGTNLDETGVISTTAEGGVGAADSSTAIYSTTARSNVPYRVVGYVESTQATAGTWATAPSLIQGTGGAVTASFQSIGQGQTWQIVTGSRAYATTYTNSTNRPIVVKVHIAQTVVNAVTSVEGRVNGVAIHLVQATGSAAGGQNFMIDLIVPPWATYSVVVTNNAGGSTLAQWAELR